jgi:hydroxypyruvate reductase
VTVRGDGESDPSLEFVVVCGLERPPSAVVATVDTDRHDGSTDAAGAILDGVEDAVAASRALTDDDTVPFLGRWGALVETGASGTTVNDRRMVVLEGKRFYASHQGNKS